MAEMASETEREAEAGGETSGDTEGGLSTMDSIRLASLPGDLDVVMAIRTLEAVEKDAEAVADSLRSLLSSLQVAFSKVTLTSVEHLRCYSDVAAHVQETALDAASKGNKFINACLRVNEEMKGMSNMAAQLKVLRQTVDHFDGQVSKFLPRL